jgi:hypothetical protein
MRKLLLLLTALGLLVPGISLGDDLFGIAANSTGANRFSVNKFGRNQDADTTEDAVYEGSDLGGPIRCFADLATTAVALYISSDDPSDASDGALPVTVTVEALDANWDLVTIEQALGATVGATGSALTQIGSTTLMRVNRAYVSGTNPALGNIYINADNVDAGPDGVPDNIATKLVTGIVIGENQTLQACYTVPNDYNAYLTQYCTSNVNTAANATMAFRLRRSVEGAASRVVELHEIGESLYQCTEHDPPILFAEKTDIELTSVSSANNGSTSGTFDLVLIHEDKTGLGR